MTKQFLDGFYEHASKTIKFVEEKISAIDSEFNEISRFLNLKKIDIEKFVAIMREFYLKTFEALRLYKEKKSKEEKLKQLKDDKGKGNKNKKKK